MSKDTSQYIALTLNKAIELVGACWDADPHTVPLLIGPPGIGTTIALAGLAKLRGLTFGSLELAHCADEDVGGVPVRDATTGAILRLPIGPLRLASETPTALLFDELSRAPQQRQGTCLTIINEGRAGDFRLHADSRCAAAANGADSAGAHQMIGALLNRCHVVEVYADADEVRDGLRGRWNIGAVGSDLRNLAVDFAATSERAALMQLAPPPGYEDAGKPWASPRAIVKALKVFSTGLKTGLSGDVLFATLAGALGKEVAGAYLAVRKTRERLPSVQEIETDPTKAKVPDEGDIDAGVAVMGLCAMAAEKNPDSAWIYAGRTKAKDIRIALGKSLGRYAPKTADGIKTRLKLLGEGGRANMGRD